MYNHSKLLLLLVSALFINLNIQFSSAHSDWGANVITLTESNFQKKVLDSNDAWLVVFYAPWCGYCQKLQPIYEEASQALRKDGIKNVKLGALNADEHKNFAHQFGINGFPTLLHFPFGRKTEKDAQPFQGDRTLESIVQWAKKVSSESRPAPEVTQLTSQKVLKDNCENSQICVFAFLPPLYDCNAKCRNRYIDRLKEVSNSFKSKKWGYLWIEARSQPELEKSLEIGGFGYPALTAMNIRKAAYTLMKGSFSVEDLTEFLKVISYGQTASVPIKGAKIPDIIKTKPWDGKDLPVVDDEL